ncbi:MAG: dNTP triphosphohydrolase [Nitrospinota bacterium]
MEWKKLLNSARLGKESNAMGADSSPTIRSEFQRDFDRIAFSSAFRRLQDKAQVIPLSDSDYPRTRMTHSLEVSTVGRSLGIIAGKNILGKNLELEGDIFFSDFGAIVAAACLAHDIGNPPFGHSGEAAISQWFLHSNLGQKVLTRLKDEVQREDFLKFEGNGQGFRVLTRLQFPNTEGGLQLTYATLGAFSKYPINSSKANKKANRKSRKKHGFLTKMKKTSKKWQKIWVWRKINAMVGITAIP